MLGFTLVNQVRGDTYECQSLIHPASIAVTVMTHDGTVEAGPFDERRVGLDHLAFRVVDRDELQRWVAQLDERGVPHTGIIDTGYGPTVVFRDPDNMQLEFYVHPNPDDLQLTDAHSAEAQALLHAPSAAASDRKMP